MGAEGRTTLNTRAKGFDLARRLGGVDAADPVPGAFERSGLKEGGAVASAPPTKAGPLPALRASDEAGTERIALDVSKHDGQMLVRLDGE